MKDLYQEILDQHIAPGQMFETKDVVNENGVTFKEYINLPDSLRGYLDFALVHAEKECLIYEDERYTYKEVFEKSAQTGNALIKAGIKKGDRVAICMQNNPGLFVMNQTNESDRRETVDMFQKIQFLRNIVVLALDPALPGPTRP